MLSPEKIRATTGGIVAPPTFPKPHYPTRIPYCNRLYALICFHTCTIPLAFCRVRVCVCLVGFASLQSPWAHTLKASLPCLPLPLPPILPFPQPLQKDNNPLPRTMFLPPLSKVRCCRPKKFGRLPEGLLYTHQPFQNRTIPPTFRRVSVCVCLYGFVSALSLAQYHVLASPRKMGGGTAVEVFRLAVQYSDSPAFTILKLFRAVTVGIAPHPHHQ